MRIKKRGATGELMRHPFATDEDDREVRRWICALPLSIYATSCQLVAAFDKCSLILMILTFSNHYDFYYTHSLMIMTYDLACILCVCVCVCIYICVCACICMFACICMCACVSVRMCVCLSVCV